MKTLSKIFHYIIDENYRFLVNAAHGKYDNWSDEKYLLNIYKATFRKELNLDCPKTFNEKMQWLKLNYRKPQFSVFVDKYAVREYIADVIGTEYLIPLIAVWDSVEEIEFDDLPLSFVLKCNHNSGLGMCICKDKNTVDFKKIKKGLNTGLKQNYYLTSREYPYKDVKRKIVCEKYMINTDEIDEPLEDYKVLCFNGKAKLIELHKGRFTDHYTQDFYDINWCKTNYWQVGDPVSKDISPKPFNLDKMIGFSEKISEGFPFLRVDWYENNNELYFSEITFYDGSGLVEWGSPEMDEELGSWIELPSVF